MLYGHNLQLFYNALIKTHFTYGITIWGNTKTVLTAKRIIRIISFSECCAHTAPLFVKYSIMSLITYIHISVVCLSINVSITNFQSRFQIYFKGILPKECITI